MGFQEVMGHNMKHLLWFLVFAACVEAQVSNPIIRSRAVDPVTCSVTPGVGENAIYYNTTSQQFKYCSALNTWTAFGTGAGTVTSLSATAPIVVAPNPITGVGTISCPTCSTSTPGIGPLSLVATVPTLANFSTKLNQGTSTLTSHTNRFTSVLLPAGAGVNTAFGVFEAYPTAPFTKDYCIIRNGVSGSTGAGHYELIWGAAYRASGSAVWDGIITNMDSALSLGIYYLVASHWTGDGAASSNTLLSIGSDVGNFQCYRITDDNAGTCTFGFSGDGFTYVRQLSQACAAGRDGIGVVFVNSGDQSSAAFDVVHSLTTGSLLTYTNGVNQTP